MKRIPQTVQDSIEGGHLPSPPEMLLRLMNTVDDDQATTGDLAKIVEQDPGLASRILSVANSPALRLGRELKTLEACLVALGTRLVRSLATCLSIQRLFDRNPKLNTATVADFWSHSLLVGELARSVAELVEYPHPDETYLAGLLHDIGELILLTALGDPYRRYLKNSAEDTKLQAEEIQLFGTTHAEVGGWLIDQWGLDTQVADAVAFHHASAVQILTATSLPQIIWIAQAMSATDDNSPEIGMVLNHCSLKLEISALLDAKERSIQRTRQIAEALGIKVSDEFPKRSSAIAATNAPFTPPSSEAEEDIATMVGGMALLQPLQQDLFQLGSDTEVLLALRESARILFELPKVAILLANDKGDVLSGDKVGAQPEIFRQLSIPMISGRALAAAAVIGRQVRTTFDQTESPTLLDLQLARALSADGLLCIPMLARSRTVGVMICGLSEKQYGRLQRRIPWLANFGKIAAISLDALTEANKHRQQVEEELAHQFTRQARQIVHEAGNPLGIIKSYLKILERKLPEDGVREELTVLTEEIDRVANIVGHMTHALKRSAEATTIDLVSVLNDFLLLYADPLFNSRGIRIETALPQIELPVQINRDNLKQIVLNLWKNASEALVAGKTIKISVSDNIIHDGASYVQLRVDDNGPGMPEETIQSIYHPKPMVYTSQRGLGLSVVGLLSKQEGILITCRSQIGAGTSIALLIPKNRKSSSEK
ncbi:HDOD domain-containing protein [Dechloromonas sp. HYN0024]|uniref:HDOD domain-containing protein n=1 Tax=Dechloromonas sp. HYN0024 TaxID=2231055 RepID=UPI000E44A09F|nr:HDOD domain-containing protein [Dechloromonas sp. HYN0024]AXS79088.1 HDOD domain-containing protein [Dechloromonas sp. HYN0024]